MPEPELPHTLEVTTENGKWTAYYITATGGIAAAAGVDAHDNVGTHGVVGKVGGGSETYRYGGHKKTIESNDPDNLLLSVNGGKALPAREFGAREADFSEEFGRGFGPASASASAGGPKTDDGGRKNAGRDSKNGGGSSADANVPIDDSEAESGPGPSIDARLKRSLGSDHNEDRPYREQAAVIASDSDYADAWRVIPHFYGVHRHAVADGTYHPGVNQLTAIPDEPQSNISFVGNWEHPERVDVRVNHNFDHLGKFDHFWAQGMTWQRTQVLGAARFENMIFVDRNGEDSAIGGKPGSGCYLDCRVGDGRETFAARYPEGGKAYFGRGCVFSAENAYFKADRSATLVIDGSCEFAGDADELFDGRHSASSCDLSQGNNVFVGGKKVA